MRPTSQVWIKKIFKAEAARNGGIVRRSTRSVSRYASEGELVAEVKRRNFHMVATGGQYVILCNTGGMDVIC
jgi:hypothetical protein